MSKGGDDDHECDACGDFAKMKHNGRRLCQECFDELALGKIKNQNISMFGGRCTGLHEGEESPWQSNAIRNMEDG